MRKIKRKNPFPVNKSVYTKEADWTISKKLSEKELSDDYYRDMYLYGYNEFIVLFRDDILKGFSPSEVGIDPILIYKREVSSSTAIYEVVPELYNYKGFIEGYFDAVNSIPAKFYLQVGMANYPKNLKELEPQLKKSLILIDCYKILNNLQTEKNIEYFIKNISTEYIEEKQWKNTKYYAVALLLLLKYLDYIETKLSIMTYKNHNIKVKITKKGQSLIDTKNIKFLNDEIDSFVNGKLVNMRKFLRA